MPDQDSSHADPPAPLPQGPVYSVLGDGARVGIGVFALASVSGLVMILIWTLGLSGSTDYFFFRSVEIIISIGALGLIVSFLGSASNAIAVFFAFLVITALILPTRDIVRLALVATGSDRNLEDYYGSSSTGTNLSGRVPDMAGNVVREVIKRLKGEGINVSLDTRDQLISTVTREVSTDRVLTIIDRVKSRGALELLEAISREDLQQEFLYKYRENDRLGIDVAFLRNEDLISMAYDDLSSIKITDLGTRVLSNNTSLEDSFQDDGRFSIGSNPLDNIDCRQIDFEGLSNLTAVRYDSGFSHATELLPTPEILRWQVLPGEVGIYDISVMPDVDNPVTPSQLNMSEFDLKVIDPMLTLIQYQPGAGAAGCDTLVGNDDDEDTDTYGSRIRYEMAPGHYLIGLNAFGEQYGTVRLDIARVE
jgi:hypothetical protein